MDATGMEALGALAILVGFVLALGSIVFWVWMVVDAVRRTGAEWTAARQSKAIWVTVLVGSFFLSLQLVAAVVYFFLPRRRLKAAAAGSAAQS